MLNRFNVFHSLLNTRVSIINETQKSTKHMLATIYTLLCVQSKKHTVQDSQTFSKSRKWRK